MEQIKYYKTRSGEIMEKIKVNLVKEKEVVVKFNGERINIIPHITLESSLALYSYCKNTLSKNENLDYEDLVLLDVIYSLGVIKLCTNLDIEEEDADVVMASGIREIVKSNVKNYDEIYQLIKMSIEQDIHLKLVNSITELFPSIKDQTKDLKEAGLIIEEMVKNANLEKVVNGDLEKAVLESPKPLIKPTINKTKTKSKK